MNLIKIILLFYFFININNSQAYNKILNHHSIVKSSQCLSEPFNNYNKWKDALLKTGKMSEAEFKSKLSIADYEYLKSTVHCYSITYKVEKHLVQGFVLFPKNANIAMLPAIIFNRGGSDAPFHRLSIGNLFQLPFQLASAGNVVIASQYRRADEFGGRELSDVLHLFNILESIPIVDPKRIGMAGWSRGSMMSLLALKKGAPIKSMVIGGSLVDLSSVAKARPKFEFKILKRLIPDYVNNKDSALRARSAVNWYQTLPSDIPVLMLHGQNDKNTHIEQAKRFYHLYSKKNPYLKFIEYPNGSHTLGERVKEVQQESINWFSKTL